MTAAPVVASPSTTPAPTAKVDCVVLNPATGACDVVGVVYALTQVGDRTYIGGSFKSVSGAPRANVAAIRGDGTLDPTWKPETDGVVYAMAASNDGTKIFLGGTFTTVGGQAKARLAAVTPDTGALVAGWTGTASDKVRAIAVDNGDRLYVGGNFNSVAGRAFPKLAAVSQTTGAAVSTFVPRPNGNLIALTVSDDGSRVYAGGSFTALNGVSRKGIAEVVATTAALTSFAPTEGGVTIALDVTPSGRLFASTSNNRLWAYDTGSDSVPEYVIQSSGEVQGILALDDEVYVGGHFTSISKAHLKRVQVASLVTSTGQITGWAPPVNGWYGVWTLGLTRTPLSPEAAPALSIGGGFSAVSGISRRGYARFLF
ncbi:hypothetical protein [Nocardioides speluncae]|uniref:hypothetical protein n=1 Tax=Nocardioides speluncae TaxID=2670337 RepID=UPI00197F3CBD|nr:hypothetical protein [Nocardioides speluncae]